jgi:small subunit ribosomal protein S1
MQFTRNFWPKPGNCFVMMPFGEKDLSDGSKFNWNLHYTEVLAPTIKEVGMMSSRADDIYGPGTLIEKVWQGIQEAEIVIADLTGRNPNVLFEVGLAQVIGKRVLILTMDIKDVPADLKGLVVIEYTQAGTGIFKFAQRLKADLDAARKQSPNERTLAPLVGVSRVEAPATIIHLAATFAIVEAKDGRRGILNAEDYSWTKLPRDLTKERNLQVGRTVNGAFVSDQDGQQRYSLALQENPWPRLKAEFTFEGTYRGVVASLVPGVGAFVEMRYGIRGLIPEFQLPRDICQGSEVKYRVEAINAQRRQVRLRFAELMSSERSRDGWGPFSRGQIFEGRVASIKPDELIWVQVDERTRGILYLDKMSPSLRSRFLGKEVKEGDYISVEVASVDYNKEKLVLRDRVNDAMTMDSISYEERLTA